MIPTTFVKKIEISFLFYRKKAEDSSERAQKKQNFRFGTRTRRNRRGPAAPVTLHRPHGGMGRKLFKTAKSIHTD
jgi:hypothetical protein